jgi:hypothetical protein
MIASLQRQKTILLTFRHKNLKFLLILRSNPNNFELYPKMNMVFSYHASSGALRHLPLRGKAFSCGK